MPLVKRVALGLATWLLIQPGRVSAHPQGTPATAARPEPPSALHSAPFLSRPRVGGIVLFSVSYGIAVLVPVANGFSEGREWLVAPLAGPIVGMAKGIEVEAWALVFDGIGQLAGASLFAAGDRVSWNRSARLYPCANASGPGVCARTRF